MWREERVYDEDAEEKERKAAESREQRLGKRVRYSHTWLPENDVGTTNGCYALFLHVESVEASSLAGLEDRCPWRLYPVICISDLWKENPVLMDFAMFPRSCYRVGLRGCCW